MRAKLFVATRIDLGLTLAAVLLLTQSPVAQSQEANPATQGGLEEVVVTATRRETSVQNTPMSVDALPSDLLQQTVVMNFNDFVLMVPNLSAADNGPGNKRYAIRNIQAAGEPEVGLYYDEIPIAGLSGENNDTGAQQPDLNLFDMDRIEVLKGPQGTLFGEGSMGGTIRAISKRPDLDQFGAEVQGNLADMSHAGNNKDADAMVNIPII